MNATSENYPRTKAIDAEGESAIFIGVVTAVVTRMKDKSLEEPETKKTGAGVGKC